MTVEQFKDKWLGRRIDYDSVYFFQCTDLTKQYLHECFNIKPGAYGDAKDWFLSPNAMLLSAFTKTGGQALPGDIVVYNPTPTNPHGHIGIAINNAVMLEQNGTGGGDGLGTNAIRLRTINYARVLGLLRPKSQGGDEMISSHDEAQKLYKMLRPNGNASAAELLNTVGKRSFKNFINDATAEIENRDANIANQIEQLRQRTQKINDLEKILKLKDDTIVTLNSELETAKHLLEIEAEKVTTALPSQTEEKEKKPSLLTRLFMAWLKLREKKA